MNEIVWRDVNTNLDNAYQAIRDAHDKRALSVLGLIDTGIGFGKTVQQRNHDDVMAYINGLTREQLADKKAVDEQIAQFGNANFFGVDKGVINPILDNRGTVLNARAMEDIETSKAVDFDVGNKIANIEYITEAFKGTPMGDGANVLLGEMLQNATPTQIKVASDKKQENAYKAREQQNKVMQLDRAILDAQIGDASQAIAMLASAKARGKDTKELAKQIGNRYSALLKDPAHYGRIIQEVKRIQDDSTKRRLTNDSLAASIKNTNTNIEATKVDTALKVQKNDPVAAANNAKADALVKAGLPSDTIDNTTGKLNPSALRAYVNTQINAIGISPAEMGNGNFKTLEQFMMDEKTKKAIASNSALSSPSFWDITIGTDQKRPQIMQNKISQMNIPEPEKIALAQHIISNVTSDDFGFWSGDDKDITKYLRKKAEELKNRHSVDKEQKSKEFFNTLATTLNNNGYYGREYINALGIDSKSHKWYKYLSPDQQGLVDVATQAKQEEQAKKAEVAKQARTEARIPK